MANTTETAQAMILDGKAIRSSDCTPSAQTWLRKQVATGRLAKLTGIYGWCPAHSNWTFYVAANRAPAFRQQCLLDYAKLTRAAAVDQIMFGNFEAARKLTALADEWEAYA